MVKLVLSMRLLLTQRYMEAEELSKYKESLIFKNPGNCCDVVAIGQCAFGLQTEQKYGADCSFFTVLQETKKG